MKRLVLLLGILLLVPAGSAGAAPGSCRSGTTVFVDGPLRIFALPTKPDPFGNGGWIEYACLHGRGRPLEVGDDIESADGYVETQGYSFAGRRYLAVAGVDVGENGGDLTYVVYDLRRRRTLATREGEIDEDNPAAFRLTARGKLVTLELGTLRAGGRRVSASASDAALGAGTLYWTEGGAARSAPLAGAAPDDVLGAVGFFGHSACELRPGATVARSPHVRVARRAGGLFACWMGHRGALPLPRDADVTLAGDRWLLAAAAGTARVIDLRTGATTLSVPGATAPLLLDDGTLAFTDAAGELAVQHPGSPVPTVLSAPGFSAPAFGYDTLYWTAGGAAHRWSLRPPEPPGRSPGGS